MVAVVTYPGAVYPSQSMAVNSGTQQLQAAVAGGLVTVGQFKRALIANSIMQQVSDAIPADVTNSVNMQWFNGISIYKADPLYNFVQALLGYSASQMSALLSYASTLQV